MIWTDLFYRILKAIKTMELTLTYLKINSRFRMFTTFTFLLIYAFPITVDENIIGAPPTMRNKFWCPTKLFISPILLPQYWTFLYCTLT